MARPKGYKFKFKSNRVTKFTPETLKKIEEASAVRLDKRAVCAYAEISPDTYYRWLKEIPGLSDRLDDLRELPIIKAIRTINSRLDDVNVAFRYLEKERPDDYGERLNLKHSGEIATTDGFPEDEELKKEFRERYMQNIIKRIHQKKQNESQTKGETGSQDANPR